MAQVAFIGLGNMGGPMAENLVKAGFSVTVFDLVESAKAQLKSVGAKVAESANAAVNGADIVISMLPAGHHVRALYSQDGGVVNDIKTNALVIDSSTIDAESAKAVAQTLRSHGIRFIDAPVSGGVGGAKAGTLTFIVGGDEDDLDQAREVLEVMGKNIFHAGAHGAGQIAKICNNMLLSVLMAGTSEALQMGIDNGLDPKVLSEIMLQSSGRNWTLELYNPCPDVMENVPSSNDFQGGFMVDLMKKDLMLAMQCAAQSNSNVPMGSQAQNLYKLHSSLGNGKLDFSSIFKLFSAR
ncbi:3-hydroxyisobutyrate dehydrogenase [Alteromonas flava]|uniref:3-hydroxyisobutyrate dehydrogenase n=1 Tax=Alteromonas flava TaxID=2048003 RepID=UPI000C28D7AE|nr:3-hydroxyisobutyrate dehydrogenase [Alteromonas flava]